jgi:serine protease Do
MAVEPHLWTGDIPRPAVSWRSTILGVDAEKVEGQLAQFFGVKEGVLVRSVGEGSAAQKAGLRAGDVITKVGDVVVDSPRALSEAVRNARGKGTVALTMTRDRKESAVTVPLPEQGGARPDRGPARSVRSREF